MHPSLAALSTEVTDVLQGLRAHETQLVPRDSADKWSIQQTIEHLLLSYEFAAGQVQTRLDRGSPTRVQATLRHVLLQTTMLRFGWQLGNRRATPALTPSLPATLRTGDELALKMQSALADQDNLLVLGEKLFGTTPAVSHPALGPLSMQQWRRFHQVHGRHHLGQIRAILRG